MRHINSIPIVNLSDLESCLYETFICTSDEGESLFLCKVKQVNLKPVMESLRSEQFIETLLLKDEYKLVLSLKYKTAMSVAYDV